MKRLSSFDPLNNEIAYAGEHISEYVSLVRNKDSKNATLSVNIPNNNEEWTLYAGLSVEGIDTSQPFLNGTGNGVFDLNIATDKRSYFLFKASKAKIILSERLLPMSGGYNFRDMGGFKTKNNRYTKWGKIFRADDLNNLTEKDLDYLNSIPLKSVIDFRSADEVSKAPDRLPPSVEHTYEYPISPGNIMMLKKISDIISPMSSIMVNMNKLLVSDKKCIDVYTQYFQLLQQDNDIPLAFHCSAGKDRTGMAAALFLASLGVSEHIIKEDYMASNQYLGNKYADIIKKNKRLRSLMIVEHKYIDAAFKEIKKRHNSIENYLIDVLNVDLEKMKQLYLY